MYNGVSSLRSTKIRLTCQSENLTFSASSASVDFMAELAPLPFKIADPKRDAKGRFGAGNSGNPKGRPVEDAEFKKRCRIACDGYDRFLLDIRENPEELTANRLAAGKELADRGFGKSVSKVETGGVNDFSGMTDEEVDAMVAELAPQALNGSGHRG